MSILISCCGLDCETCDARKATIKDDETLRKATAENWQKMYNAPHIVAEMINCTGCRAEGVKFAHCSKCEIRNCVENKGFATCADCADMNTCGIVEGVHKLVPDAKMNLLRLQ